MVMQKLINEIHLTLARYLGRVGYKSVAVWLLNGCLLYLEQAHFHCLLGRLIIPFTILALITVVTHPLEKPLFARLNTVLAYYLGKFTDKHGLFGGFNRL